MKLLDGGLYGRIMLALVTSTKWDFTVKELGGIPRIKSINRSVLAAQMHRNEPLAMKGFESIFSRT